MTIFKHQRDRALLVIDRDEKKRALDVAEERIRERHPRGSVKYEYARLLHPLLNDIANAASRAAIPNFDHTAKFTLRLN